MEIAAKRLPEYLKAMSVVWTLTAMSSTLSSYSRVTAEQDTQVKNIRVMQHLLMPGCNTSGHQNQDIIIQSQAWPQESSSRQPIIP